MKNESEVFWLVVYVGGFVGFMYCVFRVYYFFFGDKTTVEDVRKINQEQKEYLKKREEEDLFGDWLVTYFSKEKFKFYTEEEITNFFIENHENIIKQCSSKIKQGKDPLEKVHMYRANQYECVNVYKKSPIRA